MVCLLGVDVYRYVKKTANFWMKGLGLLVIGAFAGVSEQKLSDIRIEIDNDLTFAYDYFWRGVTMTNGRPNVQGAFSVGFPFTLYDVQMKPAFTMMISNYRRGIAAGYEEKIFDLSAYYRHWMAKLVKTVHFTLGDPGASPTWTEQGIALAYQKVFDSGIGLRLGMDALSGQGGPKGWYNSYTLDLDAFKRAHVEGYWGFYPGTGWYQHITLGFYFQPYEVGIATSFFRKNPSLESLQAKLPQGNPRLGSLPLKERERRSYLFVKYHSRMVTSARTLGRFRPLASCPSWVCA